MLAGEASAAARWTSPLELDNEAEPGAGDDMRAVMSESCASQNMP